MSENSTIPRKKSWLKLVQEEVLGKNYRDVIMMGWNTGLAQLMKLPMENKTHVEGVVVDFSFRGATPTTQADDKKILFGDVVTHMMKGRSLVEPIGLLYKWGYYLTMEGYS